MGKQTQTKLHRQDAAQPSMPTFSTPAYFYHGQGVFIPQDALDKAPRSLLATAAAIQPEGPIMLSDWASPNWCVLQAVAECLTGESTAQACSDGALLTALDYFAIPRRLWPAGLRVIASAHRAAKAKREQREAHEALARTDAAKANAADVFGRMVKELRRRPEKYTSPEGTVHALWYLAMTGKPYTYDVTIDDVDDRASQQMTTEGPAPLAGFVSELKDLGERQRLDVRLTDYYHYQLHVSTQVPDTVPGALDLPSDDDPEDVAQQERT